MFSQLPYLHPPYVSAVAQTISLSFAQDPLIRWLRPKAPLWSPSQSDINNWQYRRIQRAVLEGVVLRSSSAAELAQQFPPRGQQEHLPDCLAIPPRSQQRWTLPRISLALRLWFLDLRDPVNDNGADEKRVEMLLDTHDRSMDMINDRYHVKDLWYLEVIAVHPSLQGRGLGKIAMNGILEYVDHQSIVLECTAEQNVGFYAALGFEVIEKVNLADGGEAVDCWVMLRKAAQKKVDSSR
ncbi:GNAT family N-acetyltransferase [Aspergillus alliaceus]|uniref:GNAT family N-acetyltransferase n=1 Tax=Petromyces alliaceus TaxID=209559 RepID=UPI0012A731CC|nr:uncharacterized protein BDW43DRAFT_302492 [Aspergillus alliaceus]KAB8230401.1 hypothetical protein BDW43DRAFT_302492 [Aspergillus alliaceus]